MTSRGKPRPSKPLALVPEQPPAVVQAPPATDSPDPARDQRLAVLRLRREAHTVQDAAERMAAAVAAARALGLSWDAIGSATGTQGETVRRRHSPVRTAPR